MSDSEKCSNRLQLYLILILVNFSCELGLIMTRYDFLEGQMNDSEQCSNQLQFNLISLLVNFAYAFGPIITRFDFLEAR